MRIQAQNITMRFDDAGKTVEVFRDLSLEIASGSSMAILGKSGVGKTTLLNVLGALEYPVSGEVYIGDTCITVLERSGEDMAPIRGRTVAFIFQFHHLFPEFDAVENVAMPLLLRGMPQSEARGRAKALLERVGLSHRMTHRPGALSGGEQQRVAIARALAGEPGVLLADEPTGNLDPQTGQEITKLLLDIHREENITLLIVTHSLELATMLDRVVELTPNGVVERNLR